VSTTFFASVPDNLTIEFQHTYQSTGTFIVSGFASNILGRIDMTNQTAAVHERIHDLNLNGDSLVIIPPGSGTWTVTAGPDQRPLDNIVCEWSMGRNYGDANYSVPVLDSTVSHQVGFTYSKMSVSRETVSVSCFNAASSQNLMMYVNFLVDTAALSCVDLAIPDAPNTTPRLVDLTQPNRNI